MYSYFLNHKTGQEFTFIKQLTEKSISEKYSVIDFCFNSLLKTLKEYPKDLKTN